MKISLNEIKKLVKIPAKVSDDELIRLIGARLVEVEEVDDWSEKYEGIYIVRVETCEEIPDTHLHLCQINSGKKELTQVVCGAPNVHAGMLAVWIAPGAIIPATYGNENIKIDKRKLRGYESSGMLAAADELGLGDDHDGIIEIDPEMDYCEENRKIRPGDSFASAFDLCDKILDIENKSLTHRPDCFGLRGFAREVAGILGIKFEEQGADNDRQVGDSYGKVLGQGADNSQQVGNSYDKVLGQGADSPSEGNTERGSARTSAARPWRRAEPTRPKEGLSSHALGEFTSLAVSIDKPDLCPRYSCAVIDFVEPKKSGYFTRDDVFLIKCGMRPISPIVDVTNIIMLQTGQPLHAFDYDKFVRVGGADTPKIIVRAAKNGEKLELLDGKTIECDENDILITSNDVPVALAGAMGGKSTDIDETTNRIILESATFSLYHLRKTQMKHGIFSEAITRFTKGQPAGQTLGVLNEAISALGADPTEVADAYPNPVELPPIEVSVSDINSLLGTDYSEDLIVKTLENVGLTCIFDKGGVIVGGPQEARRRDSAERTSWGKQSQQDPLSKIQVSVPYWRTDLHIKEDIIEEVGRLLGYDNIPLSFPTRPFVGSTDDPMRKLKNRIRTILSDRLNAHEVLTYSFVSKALQEKFGENPKDSYEIVNSISPELQCFRQSLTPNLLEKTFENQKAGYKDFALYEINQVTKKSYGLNNEGVPVMKTNLSLVTTGDFYQAKAYLAELLKELGSDRQSGGNHFAAGHTERGSARTSAETPVATGVSDAGPQKMISQIAELTPSQIKKFKLQGPVAYFEFALDDILDETLETRVKPLRFSRFPSVSRDLTIQVSEDTPYALLENTLKTALENTGLIYEFDPVSIYEPEENLKKIKNVSFRLLLNSDSKTLNGDEISAIMNEVTKKLEKASGGVII